jgi:YHS domain-containing protein
MSRLTFVPLAVAFGLAACSQRDEASPPWPSSKLEAIIAGQDEGGLLTRVTDRSLVCMVNNRYMGTAQIPVEVAGRTYFGCCAMCERRLKEDENARRAVDPVSKKTVDKSLAVIARDSADNVLYFENEQSFMQANRGK